VVVCISGTTKWSRTLMNGMVLLRQREICNSLPIHSPNLLAVCNRRKTMTVTPNTAMYDDTYSAPLRAPSSARNRER
jgi:hypothetical protein